MNDITNYELSIGELKKHLNNLFNALIALCPTRNYISQFLMVLPEEYATMYDSFPEFLNDKLFRGQLQAILGLLLGPKIQYLPNSFAEKLIEVIECIFKIFSDDKWLQVSNDFLSDIRSDKIPNLFKEWILVKMQIAIKDPIHGKIAFIVLKSISENQLNVQISDLGGLQNNTMSKRGIKMDDLIVKLQISKLELEPIIHFLMNKLKIIQLIKQKIEGDTECEVVFLANSIKVEWLDDLLRKNSALSSDRFI